MKNFLPSGNTNAEQTRKEDVFMNKNLLITGVSLGAVLGSAYFMLAGTSDRKKHNLKRHTGKAVRAMEDIFDDLSSMMQF